MVHQSRWPAVGRVLMAVLPVLATACGGPAPRKTRFQVVDFRDGQAPQRYFEDFDECYYARDPNGNMDVVARRSGPLNDDPDETFAEVLHLHGIWRAVPGVTAVETTQINTTVSYWITGDSGGVGFEGGGFVVFNENRKGDVLTGELELSILRPMRQVADAPVLFQRAELTGQFRAAHDKRRVVRILNEMERYFGPMPRYEPAPPGPL